MELASEQYVNVTTKAIDNETGMDNFVYLDYKHYDEAAAVISFVLFFAIVVLNGVVIFVLVRRKEKKKNRLYNFVLHLAIADLLVGLVCVLGDGIQSALYGVYYGGDIVCRMWRFGKHVAIMVSNNILIGMSLDRFLAIRYPLKTGRSGLFRYLDRTLVFGAWFISMIASALILPFSKGVNADPTSAVFLEKVGMCFPDFPDGWLEPFVMIAAIVIYILPTLGITICYVGICIVIWKKWKSSLQLFETSRDPSSVNLQDERSPSSGLLPQAKLRSIKMTLVICLAFFVCWTPYFVLVLIDVYNSALITDRRIIVPIGSLYPLNSACNPLIFILFNLKLFRKFWDREGSPSATSYDAMSTQITST